MKFIFTFPQTFHISKEVGSYAKQMVKFTKKKTTADGAMCILY